MSLPVRCFSCNCVIGVIEPDLRQCQTIDAIKEVVSKYNITSYCCKRMVMGYFDTMKEKNLYKNFISYKQ